MKILVAGGAGFIGSNLCRTLLKKNYKVICLDNLYTSTKKNIAPFDKLKNFKFIKEDIENKIDIDCDYIFNLACPASPVHYQKDPIKTFKTSVIGTMNLLELAKKNKARFLLTSTSEVYGNPLVHPQPENYFGNVNLNGPRSCYDEGKRAAETITNDFRKFYGIDARVVRIFNTYGPFMNHRDGRVVSNFVTKSLKNEDIEIYGDGKRTRSFCYVDDTVEAMIKIFFNKKLINDPINIGSNRELTILKLALLIKKLTNSNSKIIFKKQLQDDPIQRKPDLKRVKNIINWSPSTKLEIGLKKTIKHFKNNNS